MAHDALPNVEPGAMTARNGVRPFTLKQVLVVSGNVDKPIATVTVVVGGRHETRQRNGNGPVDAIFQAINEAVGSHAAGIELTSYSVRSRGKGTDARGFVKVCIMHKGATYHGAYEHVDILLASAYAYIDALRKLEI